MDKPELNPGAVASLVDVAARVVNTCFDTTPDSTGHEMVKVRKALIMELRRTLAEVYPDTRDHNRNLINALIRRLA